MTSALEARLAERIARHGPIPFDQFQEAALYDPEGGFYASGGSAGRRGDFVTSPEVGPLFGAVVARALDRWWDELGRPDPFVVVDAGAGPGTLARAVLAAAPACAPALRYLLVERSAAQRARHGEHLVLEPAVVAFAVPPPAEGDEPVPARGVEGPVVVSLDRLPREPVTGVILANELLDNLPVALLERAPGGWLEVRVGVEEGAGAGAGAGAGVGGFAEILVPADGALAEAAARAAPDARPGARIPVERHAVAWLREALGALVAGRVVVFDYADRTGSLARRPWSDWLRTYRAHERGGAPLDAPGSQDITCEVAVDQLSRVRAPDADRDQAGFLAAHGLGELVEEGRQVWAERARFGDLAALRARSRVREGEALTDPGGLGAFRVLEWVVG
ncbi:MAG: SAM-dependent methyltransferase [Acidimicrobiales bacterium]|nr:SAM-dependent methyltransferase [Acidimicrobiales bacterium]